MRHVRNIGLGILLALVASCATRPRVTAPPSPVGAPQVKSTSVLTIHFIDVGQGNCFLIECPGGNLILNDCGSVSRAGAALTKEQTRDYIHNIVKQYTPTNSKPLTVFVSHSDRDHLNQITDAYYGIDTATVNAVYYSEDLSYYNKTFNSWVAPVATQKGFGAQEKDVPFMACGKANVDVMMVNTDYPAKPNGNADSIVLRVRYGTFSAIFTGDADGDTQDTIIKSYPSGFSPTLLVGSHHGADTLGSNDEDWAKAANPQMVVFSAGAHQGYRHPRCDSVEHYRDLSKNLKTMKNTAALPCGKSLQGSWSTVKTNKAILTTNYDGTVVVQVDAAGKVTVNCSRKDCS